MSIPLTVALLTYNRSHYLRQSLQAILAQTYGDFELLVLDNASTDDTPDVVLDIKDSRLRYIRNAPGYTARFNGLSAMWIARGVRLLVTHDDDIMEPQMLERQMALIAEHPELTAVWTNKSVIDEQGTLLQPWFSPPGTNRIYAPGEYIACAAEEKLWHPPSSLIFCPQLLPANSLFRAYHSAPGLRRRQPQDGSGDHILPALMNLKGPVAFLNEPLLRYRQHAVQETQHVHISRAVLYRFQTFRRFVRKTTYRETHEALFDAQVARYKAQDLAIHNSQPLIPAAVRRRLATLLQQGAAGIASNPRAAYLLLPLVVLLQQLGQGQQVTALLQGLSAPGEESQHALRALYQWARRREAGENLFNGRHVPTSIAILGSALLAVLLILEARQAGIKVVCCLDSNITRQGASLLGVPIVAHAWLAAPAEAIDLVLLSAERDHETELEELVRQQNAQLTVLSWKALAEQEPVVSPLAIEQA